MKKRALSLLLALILFSSLVPAVRTEAHAAGSTLESLQARFPTGAYWNHYVNNYYETGDYLVSTWNESFSNSVTSSPCHSHNLANTVGLYDCNFFDGAIQCVGFARKIAYEVYGTRASGWPTSTSVKPGDVLTFYSAITDPTYGHTVFVLAVSGTGITVAEASVEGRLCQIRWGHTYDMNSFYRYTVYSAPYALSETSNPQDIGDDFYARIKNPTRNMYVTNDIDNVSLRSLTDGVSQIWFFDRQDDGSYLIRSPLNGKVLDVGNASASAGANLQTCSQNRSTAQMWRITGKPGAYQFSAMCTPCVMDITNADWAEGTNIQMWTINGSDAQSFDIEILKDLSPLPKLTSNKKVYNPGEPVTITWPYVYCANGFWIDIWTGDNAHPISQNLAGSTSFTFTPSAPGSYIAFAAAIMVDTNYVSEPYHFTVAKAPFPFTDVPTNSFYAEPVLWALENNITTGTSATKFDPNGKCQRAQVVTFLHRAAGNPEPTSSRNPFSDVKSGSFFYKPVLWAVEKGITTGISDTKFGSYDVCNRAAVVTFLWRAAGSPEPKSTVNPFKDVRTKDFFYKPVLWAMENGITTGLDATHFGPTTACNRAQVVTFLYRANH